MNTPADDGDSDLRYAEYVLGVLEAQARAEVEREIATSESAAAAVAMWRRRLQPLCEEIAPQEPPPDLLRRILGALQLEDSPHRGARSSLWQNLPFWRWLSLGTGALLAAACAALVTLLLQRPAAPPIPYMASTLSETTGHVGWTATMDIGKSRMIVVPAAPEALSAGRAPELWLIPKGGKPIAVGMISTTAPVTIELRANLVARLGPTAALAVSVEPPGGSPTGQPTGPVIATGAIGAAPAGARGSGSVAALQMAAPYHDVI